MILHHEVGGDGPAVVLVHAGICDSRMWDPQWPALTASHRVLRADLRGFGRTPLPPEPYSHGRDLLDTMDAAGIERAAVVGGSLGGRLALELALGAPGRVSALVTVCAGLADHQWSQAVRDLWTAEDEAVERGDLDAAAELNVRLWVDGPRRSPEQVDGAVRAAVRTMQRRALDLQVGAWEQAEEEPFAPDLGVRLHEIAQPALVILGEEDQPDIAAIADRLARTLPHAEAARIAGAAHVPNMERPQEFTRLVGGFLSRV